MKQLPYKTIKELEANQDIQIIDGDRGKNYPKKEEFKSTGFCVFLNASNIKDDTFVFESIDFISEEKDNLLRKGKLSRNDIIITTRGTVGLVAYYGNNIQYDNIRINSGMIIIRVNRNVINPNYFYQLLKSKSLKKQYQLFASGCAQPQLPIQDFRLISIPVFSKIHQDKIAKILSNYDDLIENNNRRIKILEEMAQKIYKEWFVDFKFPGHETTTFKDSPLGKIPNDWDVKKTTDLGETLTGKTPSKAKNSYYGADIPFIKTPDMHNSIFCIKTNEMLSKIGAESQKNKYVPANSICVSCIGTVGVVSITTKICQTNQQINTIIPKKEFYREFIYFYFSNLKNKLENLGANGATMTNVNKNKFDNIEILKPNNDLLQTFSKIIAPFFEEVKILSIKNESLKQTRDILLPRLISGEINVENMEVL